LGTDGTEPRESCLPSTASRILVAHAVEKAALWLLLLAADLRLQLINARVGALERLIHDQCGLHQRVDCLRRPSQSIRN
jgi:hypothetical protein